MTDGNQMEEYNALMQTWLKGTDIASAYHAIGNMVSYEEQVWTNRKIAAQLTKLSLKMGDNFDQFASLDSIIKNKLNEYGISFTEENKTMIFANKLDYTFEVADRTFIMRHDDRGGHVFVMNESGDTLVNLFNYSELWTEGEAFPLPMAKMLMTGFEAGFNDGVRSGVFRAQHEMRQALGL